MTFRDDQAMCPFCDERALSPQADHGTRLRCDGCKGLFVPAAEVEDMILHLMQEPWSLDVNLQVTGEGVRTCPRCAAKMQPVRLFSIPLDRCVEHGIWFDAKELAMVLESASGIDPFLIAEGPQYADLTFLAKLKTWFSSRNKGPQAPRRPSDED